MHHGFLQSQIHAHPLEAKAILRKNHSTGSWQTWPHGLAQQLQTDAVAAAQRALDVVSNQYRAGTVGYLNVLSAQTTVLSAQRNLIEVHSRRLAAVNMLLKNVAGRWAVERS